MGFGAPNFTSQNQNLVQSMLGEILGLSASQTNQQTQFAQQDQDALNLFNQQYNYIMGQTPTQQKASVNFGEMDFIKTGPKGLANSPAPNSAGLNLLGR